jgi:hypothetical protein
MLARSNATSMPKGTARRNMAVKPLLPHDPDDNAFVLVKGVVLFFSRKKTPDCCVL